MKELGVSDLDELAKGERYIFVLTGITDGLLAAGIREVGEEMHLQSFVLDSNFPEPRLLEVKLPK